MDLSIAKKILLSVYPLRCCPYCGARITESKNNMCSACGSEISERFIRDLARVYVEKTLRGTSISPTELNRAVSNVSLVDISNRFTSIMDSIERKIFSLYREKIFDAKKSRNIEELRRISSEIREIKSRIFTKINEMQNAQIRAITTNTIEDIERAYKIFEEFRNEIARYMDPKVIGLYVIPEFSYLIADRLYKAMRFNDAVQWYGTTITANLFPESRPDVGKLPLYMTATSIPFGALFLESYDIDYDGIREIFYVPSREVGGLEIPCSIINEIGIVWQPFKGYDILVPKFGRFGDYSMLILAWESDRLADAKILNMDGEEMRIRYGDDTYYSIPVISARVLDVDGDGMHELLITSLRGRFFILKMRDDYLEANCLTMGNIVDCAMANMADGSRLIVLSQNGRLLEVDPATLDIDLLLRGIEGAEYSSMATGDLDGDGIDEIYLSTPGGVFRIGHRDGDIVHSKIQGGNTLGVAIWDINSDRQKELVIFELKERGIIASIHVTKEFLGGKTLDAVKSYYAEIRHMESLKRARFNFINIFNSRPYFLVSDADGDHSPEIFIGLEKCLVSIDMKYS